MFGTIRRHQKWLWIVISTVTIISFVAFFSPQRRRQGGWTGAHDQVGSIDGRPVTRDQYANAYREAELRYVFTYGDWPGNDASSRQSGAVDRETRNRLLLLDKLKQMDVQVGDSAVAEWIADAFRDRTDKSFRKDTYDNFVKNVLPARGLSQSDFERFARHEVAIQHLAALAGAAGKLIPPQEAAALFRRENEEADAEAVFISSSNYLAQVTADPAAIATYYTNQQANYRVPEKIQVSYVKFAVSNFLASADQTMAKNTNLNQYLDTTYLQRGTNTFKDANNLPLPPDAAKQKIREEVRHSLAIEEAQKKAIEFANELFELKDKTNSLASLAAQKGLVSEVTEPFSQFETPKGLNVPSSFGQQAARLTPDEPFAEQPIVADDGVYIIALNRKVPSEVPPLDTVRDRVTQDYQNAQALELARAAGRDLHAAVTNALAQGKTFDAAVAEKNFSPTVLAPFSRKATTLVGVPNRSDSAQLVSVAFSTPPGKVSEFNPTRTGGFLVYVKNILPVSEDRVKSELPEFTKTLRQGRQYEAFSEWFRKQMDSTRISLPGDKQRASAR
jgi:parvulin-like peptidyl-prolyl isomerase